MKETTRFYCSWLADIDDTITAALSVGDWTYQSQATDKYCRLLFTNAVSGESSNLGCQVGTKQCPDPGAVIYLD